MIDFARMNFQNPVPSGGHRWGRHSISFCKFHVHGQLFSLGISMLLLFSDLSVSNPTIAPHVPSRVINLLPLYVFPFGNMCLLQLIKDHYIISPTQMQSKRANPSKLPKKNCIKCDPPSHVLFCNPPPNGWHSMSPDVSMEVPLPPSRRKQ